MCIQFFGDRHKLGSVSGMDTRFFGTGTDPDLRSLGPKEWTWCTSINRMIKLTGTSLILFESTTVLFQFHSERTAKLRNHTDGAISDASPHVHKHTDVLITVMIK